MQQYIKNIIQASIDVKQQILADAELIGKIEQVTAIISKEIGRAHV